MQEDKQRNWEVIVTGASSGIGKAFALHYAKRHNSILLIGRREGNLANLKNAIISINPLIDVDFALVDLSHAPDRRNICTTIRASSNLQVLINNAGYNIDGHFLDTPLDKWHQLCDTHMTATMDACHHGLPNLLKNHGTLINVASISAYMPSPMAPLYSATKCFIKNFTMAIDGSYKKDGLKTVVLCPGYTISDFHTKLGIQPDSFYRNRGLRKAWTAEQVVSQALTDLASGRVISTQGWNYRLIRFAFKHTPERIIQRILRTIRSPRI